MVVILSCVVWGGGIPAVKMLDASGTVDVTIASGEARFRAVQRLPQDVLTQSQMLIKLYALSRHSKFTLWIHRSTRVLIKTYSTISM